MILTITMNPSVDIGYSFDSLLIGQVNRVLDVSKTAGGKGLNVTRVLKSFQAPVMATGVLGGELGMFIRSELQRNGVVEDFLTINKPTRNCIAVIHDSGHQTEILEPGPTLTKHEGEAFLFHLESLLSKDITTVTVSGSLPKGLADDFYVDVVKRINKKGAKCLLDTSNQALVKVLESDIKPFIIKPNLEELEALLNQSLSSVDDQIAALHHERFNGVDIIVLSKGKHGAIVKWKDTIYEATLPKVTAVNPVGSGDATVAGLAFSIEQQLDPDACIKTAMTAGVLNAMEKQTGAIDHRRFNEIYEKISLTKRT